MDGRLPASLINLPAQITGDVDDEAYHSLAVRDLQRGQAIGLPSRRGRRAAHRRRAARRRRTSGSRATAGATRRRSGSTSSREADVVGDGDRLGPVGGRIVGEVLIGLLNADPESFRAVDPGWRPTLPAAEPGALQSGRPARMPHQRPRGDDMSDCTHLDTIDLTVTPSSTEGCSECLSTGGWWVHLRECMTCGEVGCCDNSPNKHATAHFHATEPPDHPLAESPARTGTGATWTRSRSSSTAPADRPAARPRPPSAVVLD